MDSLLDRLAAIDAARLVAVAGATLVLLLEAAWIASAVTGRWTVGGLVAAVVAAVIAAMGLLYAFQLGTPPEPV